MYCIEYQGRAVEARVGETVLEACLRQGVALNFSCRGGSCHTCLSRCVEGELPARAQRGVRDALAAKGYFLPCVCVPEGDLRMERPRPQDMTVRVVLQERTWLSEDVCRLAIEPFLAFDYRPGQCVDVVREDGRARTYSIASHPEQDSWIELHVRRYRDGDLSPWLCERLEVGAEFEIRGPFGEFVYSADDRSRPLLLVAAGTGLAPALGVVRDAIVHGHAAPIHLYHGSRHREGLYLHDALGELAAGHPMLRYHPCLSSADTAVEGIAPGRAHDVAAADHPQLAGWRVYVAGPPQMAVSASARFRERGVAESDLLVDAFEPFADRGFSTVVAAHVPERATPLGEEVRQSGTDDELWAALGHGPVLRRILEEFYDEVFADPLLSPYFHGSTPRRSVEKVYSFLHGMFTGEDLYFGDRPRNAHHWMVISNRLFDYREDMFFRVVRRHGLSEASIARWRALQERYRADIVKSDPWPKVVHGVAMPLEGFGSLVLDVGAICDACSGEMHVGENVKYHLRLGTTYCSDCSGQLV